MRVGNFGSVTALLLILCPWAAAQQQPVYGPPAPPQKKQVKVPLTTTLGEDEVIRWLQHPDRAILMYQGTSGEKRYYSRRDLDEFMTDLRLGIEQRRNWVGAVDQFFGHMNLSAKQQAYYSYMARFLEANFETSLRDFIWALIYEDVGKHLKRMSDSLEPDEPWVPPGLGVLLDLPEEQVFRGADDDITPGMHYRKRVVDTLYWDERKRLDRMLKTEKVPQSESAEYIRQKIFAYEGLDRDPNTYLNMLLPKKRFKQIRRIQIKNGVEDVLLRAPTKLGALVDKRFLHKGLSSLSGGVQLTPRELISTNKQFRELHSFLFSRSDGLKDDWILDFLQRNPNVRNYVHPLLIRKALQGGARDRRVDAATMREFYSEAKVYQYLVEPTALKLLGLWLQPAPLYQYKVKDPKNFPSRKKMMRDVLEKDVLSDYNPKAPMTISQMEHPIDRFLKILERAVREGLPRGRSQLLYQIKEYEQIIQDEKRTNRHNQEEHWVVRLALEIIDYLEAHRVPTAELATAKVKEVREAYQKVLTEWLRILRKDFLKEAFPRLELIENQNKVLGQTVYEYLGPKVEALLRAIAEELKKSDPARIQLYQALTMMMKWVLPVSAEVNLVNRIGQEVLDKEFLAKYGGKNPKGFEQSPSVWIKNGVDIPAEVNALVKRFPLDIWMVDYQKLREEQAKHRARPPIPLSDQPPVPKWKTNRGGWVSVLDEDFGQVAIQALTDVPYFGQAAARKTDRFYRETAGQAAIELLIVTDKRPEKLIAPDTDEGGTARMQTHEFFRQKETEMRKDGLKLALINSLFIGELEIYPVPGKVMRLVPWSLKRRFKRPISDMSDIDAFLLGTSLRYLKMHDDITGPRVVEPKNPPGKPWVPRKELEPGDLLFRVPPFFVSVEDEVAEAEKEAEDKKLKALRPLLEVKPEPFFKKKKK